MYFLRAIRLLRLTQSQRFRPSIWAVNRTLNTTPSEPIPWFMDPEEQEAPPFARRPVPPHLPEMPYELPTDIPEPIKVLYEKLSTSPFLELSTLVAQKPPQIPPGPPLPHRIPKGRRRIRGKTYAGKSLLDTSSGIWSWVVMAQVRELDPLFVFSCMNFHFRLKRAQKTVGRSNQLCVWFVRRCVVFFSFYFLGIVDRCPLSC
jgi:hypothetical protein